MVPENTPNIYDGMALFQKLPPTLVTFGDISDYVLKKIMKGSSWINFSVTDCYLPESVKSLERNARSKIGLLRTEVSRRDQLCPKQFDKYLWLSQNKINLVSFLIKGWSSNTDHCQVSDGKELYATFKDKAFCISAHCNQLSQTDVDSLSSQQEEADTKMFLAAQFAFELGFERVNIITIDTDVVVLAIYFQELLNETIYLQYGTSTRTQIYNMSSHTIKPKVAAALPGMHAIRSCDSTSCFEGKGNLLI